MRVGYQVGSGSYYITTAGRLLVAAALPRVHCCRIYLPHAATYAHFTAKPHRILVWFTHRTHTPRWFAFAPRSTFTHCGAHTLHCAPRFAAHPTPACRYAHSRRALPHAHTHTHCHALHWRTATHPFPHACATTFPLLVGLLVPHASYLDCGLVKFSCTGLVQV